MLIIEGECQRHSAVSVYHTMSFNMLKALATNLRIRSFVFSLQPVPQDDVVCVSKEVVHDKNAVNLKLKASSNCVSSENTSFCLFMYRYIE